MRQRSDIDDAGNIKLYGRQGAQSSLSARTGPLHPYLYFSQSVFFGFGNGIA